MSTTTMGPPPLSTTPILFGKFTITSSVFYLTPHTIAFVNLKPLLPGHVLVSPRRIVPRLFELRPDEIADLFLTVQRVGRMLERVYHASALNIAIQDGADAGQSVPHVHAHLIPRRSDDAGQGDKIYDMLEGEDGNVGRHLALWERERPRFPKVDDEGRRARSEEEMREEAEMLRKEMERTKL